MDIFTTNYDMIIEQYHWDIRKGKKRPRLRTGFLPSSNPYLHEFKPQESYGSLDPHIEIGNVRRLFKLHGSIDQKIEDYVAYKCPRGYQHDIQFAEDMMVFPVAEKYVTRYPYYDLHHYLRGVPWTVGSQGQICIVIGFSFRDIPVINSFINHIIENERRNVQSTMILIDKCPESVMENLAARLSKKDFGKICERIDSIKGEFGSTKAFSELEEKVRVAHSSTIAIDSRRRLPLR